MLCFYTMVAATKNISKVPLYQTKLAKFNFIYVAIFAIYIIIFDAGNVVPREAIYHRWVFAVLMLSVFTLFWVVTKKATNKYVIFGSLLLCILTEIALAGFTTYWERGMASMSTVLYIFPITSAALTASRTYTVGTAMFCAAAYLFATTKYFYDFFNEGYRVQLYAQVFFFGALFLLISWIIATIAHASKTTK